MAADSDHLTDMAGRPKAKRRCIFWRTEDYNDDPFMAYPRGGPIFKVRVLRSTSALEF